MKPEYVIVGGGVVGCAVAFGLLKAGHAVTVLDGGDSEYRASRGNFGLVWLSSKGLNAPHYAAWTRKSIHLWAELARELENHSGQSVHLVQQGGYDFYFSQSELENRMTQYKQLGDALGCEYPVEAWDAGKLKAEEPHIGDEVAGAIYGREDGHVNPLKLLRAYTQAVTALGGRLISGVNVCQVTKEVSEQYRIMTRGGEVFTADKIVLAAGLGAASLGPSLGFKAPVTPQKGQVLITEKLPPLITRPSGIIRQVNEGGIQIGDSKEEVGFNDQDTLEVTAAIAERAIAVYPFLANVRLVRSWGAIRIMSPDGLPIYQESSRYPGVYLVSCHSGITLAAAHSYLLPHWLEQTADSPDLELFSEKRF